MSNSAAGAPVDAPEPLDTELAAAPPVVGERGRRILWMIGLLALLLRLILLPLGHWWDLTVDYNVFIDLARNHSPYETFSYLSHIARSAEWDTVYEYYAYPPVPLYIYYPLAKLYILLHPHAQYFIAVSGSYAVPNLTPDFFFLFKLPIWIADFLVAALLARMSGTVRGFRDYLLNPYVLLISGAWTFDAIMLLGLVGGIYAIYRGKILWSGIALAFGTMVKFFPALAVPVVVIYLLKKKRPFREIVLFVLSYIVACTVFLGPFLKGVMEVVSFHGVRPGGGMTWQFIWTAGALYRDPEQLRPILDALAVFGMPALLIVLLLAYWYCWQTEMTLNRMVITALAGFFVGSKLINEQYALLIIPFLWLEAYRAGGVWRWFYRLCWIIPLGFAVFRVPIDRFFWLFYHMVLKDKANITITTGMTGFEWTMIPWKHPVYAQLIGLVLALGFFLLSFAMMFWPAKAPARLARLRRPFSGQGSQEREGGTVLERLERASEKSVSGDGSGVSKPRHSEAGTSLSP
ncbi:MAG: hypothetical protein IMW89_01765 [Ktedonobacteraceae bacterium]|nr:hypothetical protein [Ktedonobacteraceae bacterium]